MLVGLSRIAPLIEILASLAVVVSVIYLAQEIRTSTSVAIHERNSEMYDSLESWIDLAITDQVLRSTTIAAEADYLSLTKEQALLHQLYYLRWFNLWERSWGSHQSGLMDDNAWKSWENGWIKSTPCHAWHAWRHYEPTMNAEMVDYLQRDVLPNVACSEIATDTEAGT